MKQALIKLHIAVFLWGFTGILGKLISLNEGWLVWYRMLLTVATLFLFLFFKKQLILLPKKILLQLLGIGTIVALHWVCFYGSIKYSNVSIALTCLSSAAFFTAILEPLFHKKKINFVEIVLGLMGILGIWLIYHFNAHYQKGMIIGLIACLLSVIFSVMNKKMVVNYSSSNIMFYELLGGFLVLTCLMPLYGKIVATTQFFPTNKDWLWLIIFSWCCTIVPFLLSLQALKKLSTFTLNIALNLEPVYGIILAFLIFNEDKLLDKNTYYGFAIIIATVVFQTTRLVKNKPTINPIAE